MTYLAWENRDKAVGGKRECNLILTAALKSQLLVTGN